MHLLCNYCNYINNDNVKIPKINKKLKEKVNDQLRSFYNDYYKVGNLSKKYTLGVLYFENDEKTFIHCPIKKVCSNGLIKFGKCKNFIPLENNHRNRQKLCTHKFRYHFKSNKEESCRLQLKVSQRVENILASANK